MYYTYYGALQSNYSKDRRDNSWSPSNPNGKYPLWATTSGEGTEAANESNSMYVQDGSYLRMQTLTFGYTIPKSSSARSSLRAFVSTDRSLTYSQSPVTTDSILKSEVMMVTETVPTIIKVSTTVLTECLASLSSACMFSSNQSGET